MVNLRAGTETATENRHELPDPFHGKLLIGIIFLTVIFNGLFFTISARGKHGSIELFTSIACIVFGAANLTFMLTGRRASCLFSRYSSILLLSVLVLFRIATGDRETTGYIWTFSLPLCALFLLGMKRGTMVTILFFLTVLLLFLLPNGLLPWIPVYSTTFKTGYIASFFTLCLIAFLIEHSRSRAREKLRTQNDNLQQALRQIQKNENRVSVLNSNMLTLINLSNSGKIYDYIGTDLVTLIPKSIIVVFEMRDYVLTIKGIFGIDQSLFARANSLLGFHPVGKTFTISTEMQHDLVNSKLVHHTTGFRELCKPALPVKNITALEELVGISGSYSIGFSCNRHLFGGIFLFTRRGNDIFDPEFIETYIVQASAILQRQYIEESLIDQNRFLESLIAALPNPVLYKDRQSRILGCNGSFETMTGIKR